MDKVATFESGSHNYEGMPAIGNMKRGEVRYNPQRYDDMYFEHPRDCKIDGTKAKLLLEANFSDIDEIYAVK